MTVKQISVFVENKSGCLAELTKVLSDSGIDMRALSIAETPDFGILRIIVSDPLTTACVLKEAGYVSSLTPVIAAEVADEPGSVSRIFALLADGGINLEYTYAFLSRKKETAYLVLRVADNEKAANLLRGAGISLLNQETLSAM